MPPSPPVPNFTSQRYAYNEYLVKNKDGTPKKGRKYVLFYGLPKESVEIINRTSSMSENRSLLAIRLIQSKIVPIWQVEWGYKFITWNFS